MDHETKKLIERALDADELSRFNDDYLVDVFRVWDCYEQEWVADSPILLRFEEDDALVFIRGEKIIETVFGPVDNAVAIVKGAETTSEDQCLCWLRVRS